MLRFPSETTANILNNVISSLSPQSICRDCCSIVEEGRDIFKELSELEQEEHEIRRRFRDDPALNLEQYDAPTIRQISTEIRRYLNIVGE